MSNMYTAKVTAKEETTQGLKVSVEFYRDGNVSHTESVIPQDRDGFFHWLKSRLTTLNSGESLKTELVEGEDVTVPETVVEEVVLTQAEKDRAAWLEKYYKWVRIKTTMIDTGILTGNETQVQNFLADIKTGFKPAYIEHI
jgi:hypothetical protein